MVKPHKPHVLAVLWCCHAHVNLARVSFPFHCLCSQEGSKEKGHIIILMDEGCPHRGHGRQYTFCMAHRKFATYLYIWEFLSSVKLSVPWVPEVSRSRRAAAFSKTTTFVPRGFSPRLRLTISTPPPVISAPAL